jgi:hypothetical protein
MVGASDSGTWELTPTAAVDPLWPLTRRLVHPLDEVSVVFMPFAPTPLVAPRNIVPQARRSFEPEFAPAVTKLLMLR